MCGPQVRAGEDAGEALGEEHGVRFPLEVAERSLVVLGKRLSRQFFLELDDAETRDELMRGLRIIRLEKSMLFKQRLDKMQQEEGFK